MNSFTPSKAIAASYRAKAAAFRKAADETNMPAVQEALIRTALRWERRAAETEAAVA